MFQGICQPPSRCDTHPKNSYATRRVYAEKARRLSKYYPVLNSSEENLFPDPKHCLIGLNYYSHSSKTVIDTVLSNSPLTICNRSLRTQQRRAIFGTVDRSMYQTDIDQTDLHRS